MDKYFILCLNLKCVYLVIDVCYGMKVLDREMLVFLFKYGET